MKRKVFYSFHYDADSWRSQQVRNIGIVEGNEPVSPNDWEAVKRGGHEAIKSWIASQLDGRSCTVVLIGAETASRQWVTYEISESWNARKGVVGVYIHNLLDMNQRPSTKGANPLDKVTLTESKKPLSSVAKVYDPPGFDSRSVYAHISQNLSAWVEEAVYIRERS